MRRVVQRMATNVVIVNQASFEAKKALLLKGGVHSLQVVSDFDRTMTPNIREGRVVASAYQIVGTYPKLSENYRRQIDENRSHFYPIELDPKMTREEKTPHMVEWWRRANQLLIDEKVHIDMLPDMVEQSFIVWRDFVAETLKLADEHAIPFLVFSAGLAELIEEVIRHLEGRDFPNVHVIGNRLIHDKDGYFIAVQEPVIHVYNKNEASILHHNNNPWIKSIKHRRNIILLGDSLGDVEMADGIKDPNVILKIGFVNDKVEERLEAYKAVYDVLILHDGTFEFVHELLDEIIAADPAESSEK